MKHFLSIAATDSSGGAGITKDCQVAGELQFRPLAAVTGITAQNDEHLFAALPTLGNLFRTQLETCFQSFPIDCVKIGAILSENNLHILIEILKKYRPSVVVFDPVLKSTSNAALFPPNIQYAFHQLLQYITVITPNLPEMEWLAGESINSPQKALKIIQQYSKKLQINIYLKGGHWEGSDEKNFPEYLQSPNQTTVTFIRPKTHWTFRRGTGCTFSSALACYLGLGHSLQSACEKTSRYVDQHYEHLNRIISS